MSEPHTLPLPQPTHRVPTEVAVDSKEGKRLLLEQPPEGIRLANVEQAGHGRKETPHSLG